MNLTTTFYVSLLTLVLLAGTACISTQSAVKDLPPPTPLPTPIAKVTDEPTPTPSLPADELIPRTSPCLALPAAKMPDGDHHLRFQPSGLAALHPG